MIVKNIAQQNAAPVSTAIIAGQEKVKSDK